MSDSKTPATEAKPVEKTDAKPKITKAAGDADPSTQKTVTVETTGDFQLLDPHTGSVISHEGTTEVVETQFIRDALEDGRLKEA